MGTVARLTAGAVALMVALTLISGPAVADPSFPYGDRATARIADRLHGTHRGGWLATTLDIGGYRGRRHAEIAKIPAGHGKRWVGIIHVPAGKGTKVSHALAGTWFARRTTSFVLPLKSKYDTDGCAGALCRKAARWAKRRLGGGWHVVVP